MTKKRSAFTWVELIVVLFAVTILAALLFPRFAAQRDLVRRSSCQSNLKRITLGFHQYCRDYDELFPDEKTPPMGNITRGRITVTHWVYAVQPYVKDVELFQCPAEYNTLGTDYYLNGYMSRRNASDVVKSSAVVMLTEGVDQADCSKAVAIAAQKTGASPAPYARHLDGSNYAFVDGHVKWLHSAGPPVPVDLKGDYAFRGRFEKWRPGR